MTLGALVKPEHREAIPTQRQFCFCRTASCDVGYFRENEVLFRQEDVSVRVHQKAVEDVTVPVCYCFDWTPQRIRGNRCAR